ncbi:MAG: hypothetical protein MJ083_03530 [Clostridia bacterium]|nr:hypothetical protein [Clostridia bacterium]
MTNAKNSAAAPWLTLLVLALGCTLCGFLPDVSEATAAQFAPLILLLIGLCAAALALTKKLTARRAVLLLFAAGFVLRVFYVLYTPYTVRQHDVWLVTSGKGHMGYIQYIAEHLALPDTNQIWQFTHPPLHHIVAGGLYRILSDMGLQAELIAEKLQFLTCFYSCALMVVCDRLFCRCGLDGAPRAAANAVIVFHPTCFLLGGCLNNDMLCLLLTVTSLLFFAAWWQEKTTAPLLWCGAFLGLAMMAKVSAALLAFPLAAAFAARLFTCGGKPTRLLSQYALFGAVSVPLGMWFPLRNLIRFGQPLVAVEVLSPTANASQYLAGVPVARRLFAFPASQLINPFQSWDEADPGCNVFLSLFKTSVFGEQEWGHRFVAFLLLAVSVLLALVAFAVLLWRSTGIFLKPRKHELDAVWLAFCAVSLVSFVGFCFTFPFICSQDFRYLAALLPFGALALGNLATSSDSRVLRGFLYGGIALFAVSSALLYALPHTL